MALSAHAINTYDITEGVPSFKVGSHLDFFRAEPGRVHIPSILDDSDLKAESMASLKAFMDVSAEDAKVFARWSASSFCKHQPRIICTNTFNNLEEPEFAHDKFGLVNNTITHDTFLKMLRIAFNNNACDEDIAALLKRSVVVLFGNHHVFLRLPSAGTSTAMVINYPPEGKDLLTESCKDRFAIYKQGGHVEAPHADTEWSLRLVQLALRDSVPRDGFRVIGASTCPFTGTQTQEEHIKPELEVPPMPMPPPQMDRPGSSGNIPEQVQSGNSASSSTALVPAGDVAASSGPSSASTKKRAFSRSLSQNVGAEINLCSPPKAARPSATQDDNDEHESMLAKELDELLNQYVPTDDSD